MENFLNSLGVVSDFFGAFGGIFAVLIWIKLRKLDRLDEEVKVFLSFVSDEGERKIELPLQMRRRDLTRAEFLGRIGMLPMRQKGSRFSLRFLSSPEFIQGINKVADRKSNTLLIPASQEEIEQFDL
jgi:hypothetical protein